jgi:tetratricopeptide (TPR) repeat protein
MPSTISKRLLPYAALILIILAAYSNSFQNDFHFDDFHSVTGNRFIRELRNVPRFFVDSTLSSTMPDQFKYRPVVTASLAFDYWLGHGLNPLYFHISMLFWFLVQVILMVLLFRRIMEMADRHPSNAWAALTAAAVYGLHPANAETVNYIIQRAEIYSTLGIVASLLWFAAWPAQRKWGWYLLPAVAAFLSKAPALIFPFLLLAYIFLFERDREPGANWRCLRMALPAFLVTGAAAILTMKLTPASFNAGGGPAYLYRLTQPWVALHYFKSFFLPTELSADTDWTLIEAPLSTEAVAGYVFVVGLLVVAYRTARSPEMRPIAFGIVWFLLALAPTSLMPLAEVTNDHRMFFPFVGLALAIVWSVRLFVFRKSDRLAGNRIWVRGAALGMAVVLAAFAEGTRERNGVWRTEESLWQDVSIKSPRNGRGLMNYGLVFMGRGDYTTALAYFERALAYTPNYWALEINLAVANGALHRDGEAERHFLRGVSVAPAMADTHFFYARWLNSVGRSGEAAAHLESALRINPLSFDSRYLLMQIYAQQGDGQALARVVRETLRIAPNDATAQRFQTAGGNREQTAPKVAQPRELTAESLLNLSLLEYRAGRFDDCIRTAKMALEKKPDYAEAYNNIAAAYNSMNRWDDGIHAAQEAIRLKPDYELAKNNLAWAISQKQKAAGGGK